MYETAANFLDLRYLPGGLNESHGPELARKLKVVLDRKLWVDMALVSNQPEGNLTDGLPKFRESIGLIDTKDGKIHILLQHVPRKDGVMIWKFSNRTVAQIPLLFEGQHHLYLSTLPLALHH